MTQILVTGDENAGQSFELLTPHRPEGVFVRTAPVGVLGGSGSARATNGTNVIAASGDTFLEPTGAAFTQVNGSALWTFTANTCFWTYTGPAGKRFLFTLAATLETDFDGDVYTAIDVDQALVFGPASTVFVESVVRESFNAADVTAGAQKTLTTTRLVSGLTNPGLVQPVFAHSAGGSCTIRRLSFSFAEVGPGT